MAGRGRTPKKWQASDALRSSGTPPRQEAGATHDNAPENGTPPIHQEAGATHDYAPDNGTPAIQEAAATHRKPPHPPAAGAQTTSTAGGSGASASHPREQTDRRHRGKTRSPGSQTANRRRRPTRALRHPSRRTALAAAAVAVAGLAAGLTAGLLPTAAAHLADIARPLPAWFQIVYRFEHSTSTPTPSGWEVLTSNGGFDVDNLYYERPPLSGAKPVSGSVTTYDGLYNLVKGHLNYVSARRPSLGEGEDAIGPELSDLEARGLARPLGHSRVVAGRRCQLVELSEPPAGPITPLAGAGGRDDVCIDSAGLILSQRWTYHGKLALDETAVLVSFEPGHERVAGPPPLSTATRPPPGVEVVGVVKGGRNAAPFFAPPPAPRGFSPHPVLDIVTANPVDPTLTGEVSRIWAFSHQGDIVTVEAGTGPIPWASSATPTRPLRLAGLGKAVSALRSDGPEIRVTLPGNHWVRVRGTVTLAELARYASRLRTA